MEQEFIVQPKGDLSRVQIRYRGIDKLGIAQDGGLEVTTAFGKLRETKPLIYQHISDKRIIIDGSFKLTSRTSYTFEVEPHQAKYALVIDPTLLYSTFLGGSSSNNEVVTGIAVDASGNAYIAGSKASTDFPTTPGAFQTSTSTTGGGTEFITKVNATSSALVYSTYL